MDPWRRQRVLADVTLGWGALSVLGGLAAVTRHGPWWRSFGRQHVGWGLADLGIVAALRVVQRHRMARFADPYAPTVTEPEVRRLIVILAINTVADLGYCAVGISLGRSGRARAAGAGAAILMQGAFLAVHDGWHAIDATRDARSSAACSRRRSRGSPAAGRPRSAPR